LAKRFVKIDSYSVVSFRAQKSMSVARSKSIATSINVRGATAAGAENDWATALVSASNEEKHW
jgi:hypothetical protein